MPRRQTSIHVDGALSEALCDYRMAETEVIEAGRAARRRSAEALHAHAVAIRKLHAAAEWIASIVDRREREARKGA